MSALGALRLWVILVTGVEVAALARFGPVVVALALAWGVVTLRVIHRAWS